MNQSPDLKRLILSPADNLLLQLGTQINKIIAVTGHPHSQIPVFFRLPLGLAQGFRGNSIKLNVMPVHPEIGANPPGGFLNPLLIGQ